MQRSDHIIEYATSPSREWVSVAAAAWPSYPLLVLCLIYTTGVSARIAIGHWPHVHVDDWGGPLPVITLSFFMFCLPAFAGQVGISLAALVVSRAHQLRRDVRRAILVPAIVWPVAIGIILWAPMEIMNWMMD
jgi:hypothetical protein